MFWLILALIFGVSIGIIAIAEINHFSFGYLIVFLLLLISGMSIAQEGIILDYSYSIQQNYGNDSNQTIVKSIPTEPFALTTTNDNVTNLLTYLLQYGSFFLVVLFFIRQDAFSREEIYQNARNKFG